MPRIPYDGRLLVLSVEAWKLRACQTGCRRYCAPRDPRHRIKAGGVFGAVAIERIEREERGRTTVGRTSTGPPEGGLRGPNRIRYTPTRRGREALHSLGSASYYSPAPRRVARWCGHGPRGTRRKGCRSRSPYEKRLALLAHKSMADGNTVRGTNVVAVFSVDLEIRP